jgi:phosphoribosylaminoimidazolecarboxamide formyltransferase/IMP cyclohydrolase
MPKIAITRALVSVYDKTGLDELARGLHEAGVEIVSTGSTAARIRAAGVPVTAVDEVTGFPEIMGGRVKTLHPNVHAGLLADQNNPDHVATIEKLGIAPFQLLIANLYPFAETVASGAGEAEIIEQIDIGGPAMVRASAKNHGSMTVIVSPAHYGAVLDAVRAGGFELADRQRFAREAFRHTASYDIAVASWLGGTVAPDDAVEADAAGDRRSGFPGWIAADYERAAVLRYGENPHQRAALYIEPRGDRSGIANAEQLAGKAMSYNNYVDADAAWKAAYDFEQPCVAIIKHANPCGIAVGADIAEAHRKAHACDSVSAYGGVVATNRPVTMEMAEQLGPIFTEVVVAPAYEDGVLERWAKKKDLRILVSGPRPAASAGPSIERRQISGGLLLQTSDRLDAPGDDPATWTLACGAPANEKTFADLVFAWRALRSVRSNAILLARGGATVGVGMGQVNRVDSCRLAVARAGERVSGAVAASDAFFPFPDGPQVLLDAGVKVFVQPGGSIRDGDTIEALRAAGATMYFTGARHFLH